MQSRSEKYPSQVHRCPRIFRHHNSQQGKMFLRRSSAKSATIRNWSEFLPLRFRQLLLLATILRKNTPLTIPALLRNWIQLTVTNKSYVLPHRLPQPGFSEHLLWLLYQAGLEPNALPVCRNPACYPWRKIVWTEAKAEWVSALFRFYFSLYICN